MPKPFAYKTLGIILIILLGLILGINGKKDIVLTVEKVAKKYNKKPFRVVDFTIYHNITSEKIPTDDTKMKYYF